MPTVPIKSADASVFLAVAAIIGIIFLVKAVVNGMERQAHKRLE